MFYKVCVVSIILLTFCSCKQQFTPTEWTEGQEEKIHGIVNDVSLAELQDILSELDGIRNVTVDEQFLAQCESSIITRFESYGLEVEIQEVEIDWALGSNGEETYYVYGPFRMNTIIASQPGFDTDAPPVLYTAHWDSVPMGPGINDNASGCAAVLEGARVLRDYTFINTIKYVIFALEEDSIAGSIYYVDSLYRYPKAVINLDMIGFTSNVQNSYVLTDLYLDFPRQGDFIGVFATDFSTSLGIDFMRVADTFVPDLRYYLLVTDPNFSNDPPLVHLLRSDHAPFWERGIPGILVTDTAFLRKGHPYHTEEDTIGNIDFPFMLNCVKASIATVCVQAGIR